MLEPPDLPADRIVATVGVSYGLALTDLTFLPLGHDVHAWAFRAATAEGTRCFLKLRRGRPSAASLHVPRYLADHGATHVAAPLPARDGRLCVELGDFALILYPFIDGETGMTRGMDEQNWRSFGAALRELHDTALAPEIARLVPREQFTIAQVFARQRQAPWSAVTAALAALDARADAPAGSAAELAAFWRARRAEIEALAARFEALGERLRAAPPPLVLCHADVHPNNLLIDTANRLWIVDWDEVLFAPKEADLMMGIGGLGMYPAGPREEAWFLQGYTGPPVDPVALAYYRHLRAVTDIGAYVEEVLLLPGSEAAKLTAVRNLHSMFAPGRSVALAQQADLLVH